MMFGGLAPTVSGCGEENFENMTNSESCIALKETMNRTGCTPNLNSQFNSLAYEVKCIN